MQLHQILSDLYLPVFLFPSRKEAPILRAVRQEWNLFPAVFATELPFGCFLSAITEYHRVLRPCADALLAEQLIAYARKNSGMLLCLFPCSPDAVRFLRAYAQMLSPYYLLSFEPPTRDRLPLPQYLC